MKFSNRLKLFKTLDKQQSYCRIDLTLTKHEAKSENANSGTYRATVLISLLLTQSLHLLLLGTLLQCIVHALPIYRRVSEDLKWQQILNDQR